MRNAEHTINNGRHRNKLQRGIKILIMHYLLTRRSEGQINSLPGWKFTALRHSQHPFLRVIPVRPNNPDECNFKQTANPHYLWPLDGCIKNNDVAPHSPGTRINEAIKLISLPRYIFILLSQQSNQVKLRTRVVYRAAYVDNNFTLRAFTVRAWELRILIRIVRTVRQPSTLTLDFHRWARNS